MSSEQEFGRDKVAVAIASACGQLNHPLYASPGGTGSRESSSRGPPVARALLGADRCHIGRRAWLIVELWDDAVRRRRVHSDGPGPNPTGRVVHYLGKNT